jgi:hypothetical protein
LPDDDAVSWIEDQMTREPSPADEVETALLAARGERRTQGTRWPEINVEQVKVLTEKGPNLVDLCAQSPVHVRNEKHSAEDIIDVLFPGNPLLCIGRTQQSFSTRQREAFRGGLRDQTFIVPSPMTRGRGKTQKGRISAHSLDNTGPRRFLIAEFDQGGLDTHAALLTHLSTIAPLAAVVFSGNKSLHGWFFCEGETDEKLLKFMQYSVSLGACRSTWVRSQFVRLPEGRRSDDKTSNALEECGVRDVPSGLQAVLYFNPEIVR